MDSYDFQERTDKTEFLVEADQNHMLTLWRRMSEEAYRDGHCDRLDSPRFTWEQVNPGRGMEIGAVAGRPIVISLSWVKIGGALICFYEGTSQLVDHEMIEKYLNETFQGVPRTNVSNFHNVVDHIRNRDATQEVTLTEVSRSYGRESLENFEREGILSSRLMTDYTLESTRQQGPKNPDVTARIGRIKQRLEEAISMFTESVWSPWLKEQVRKEAHRGLETHGDNVSMLMWSSAGRVLVSLRRPKRPREYDEHVTLIGADGERETNRLGLQGIHCREEEALQLVQDAASCSAALRANMRPNAEVGWG